MASSNLYLTNTGIHEKVKKSCHVVLKISRLAFDYDRLYPSFEKFNTNRLHMNHTIKFVEKNQSRDSQENLAITTTWIFYNRKNKVFATQATCFNINLKNENFSIWYTLEIINPKRIRIMEYLMQIFGNTQLAKTYEIYRNAYIFKDN